MTDLVGKWNRGERAATSFGFLQTWQQSVNIKSLDIQVTAARVYCIPNPYFVASS